MSLPDSRASVCPHRDTPVLVDAAVHINPAPPIQTATPVEFTTCAVTGARAVITYRLDVSTDACGAEVSARRSVVVVKVTVVVSVAPANHAHVAVRGTAVLKGALMPTPAKVAMPGQPNTHTQTHAQTHTCKHTPVIV